MSNPTERLLHDCASQQGAGAVDLIIAPRSRDLGGFSVRRTLPTAKRRMVGPWVFFDHMGPAAFPAGEGIDVRPHPHINLATVTYLFEGEILHRDSLGSVQAIRPGDLNLMIAGSGIVHSERERPEARREARRLHALQLWLALPVKHEEVAPSFLHYPAADLPKVTVADVALRVLMGSAYGVTSPVKVFGETLYVEALLNKGQTLRLPEASERALYVASGAVRIADASIPAHSMAVLTPAAEVVLQATEDTRIAIIGGENVGKRFMEWNFVSSRRDRIAQAKQDWKAGRFPKVPGDEEAFTPWPE